MVAATSATTLTDAAPLGANAVSHRQGEPERSGGYTLLSGLMGFRGAHRGNQEMPGADGDWVGGVGAETGVAPPAPPPSPDLMLVTGMSWQDEAL